MPCAEHLALSRRGFLLGGASLTLWGLRPRLALAAARDRRLLLVILRGGLDGLAMLAPVGDPAYAAQRGRLSLSAEGGEAGFALDGFFVLNRGMPFLHELYGKREALLFHAIASPYRGRSHFDGQDVLENGTAGVTHREDGWLNRALHLLPNEGQASPRGLALAPVVPLVMRGPAPILSWSRPTYGFRSNEDTIHRLTALYGETDPGLARAFAAGLEIDGVANVPVANGGPGQRPFRDFVETAEAAARLMAAPEGPRIGVLSYDGWDTHANEGAVGGNLFNRLSGLDAALRAYAETLGAAWAETSVLVVTEFGRTVRVNGTEGTDHGTATTAILAGGAVAGGRIVADWPGLHEQALFEGRDLKPTLDLRRVIKGVLAEQLGIGEAQLARDVFPDSVGLAPLTGLIRA